MIIKCRQIYTEEGVVDGYLVVEDGKFTKILPGNAAVENYVDYSDKRIIPGIFDTHNHGTMGYSLMGKEEGVEEEIKGYLKGLASQGVTSIFPTANTSIIKDVANVAKQENDGAKILGIHSEGPYLNRVGEKGVDTGHPDIDMDFVKKMVDDGEGLLRLVAIAPELPDSQKAIDYFNDHGARVAYAHSNCNYEEALKAFKNGITVSTHTANVMSGIHHRNMGGLGACLLDKEVWCEVICDGLHVRNEMLQIMFATKPFEKWMMVSDNAAIAGAPAGRYNFGWMPVNVDERGFCLSDTGRLCGSAKPVIFGIKNLVENMNIPIETVLKMAALNPCICYGFDKEKGSIKVGKDADYVVINDNYEVLETVSEGRIVFDHKTDTHVFNTEFLKSCVVE